jgi:hypothetical protein
MHLIDLEICRPLKLRETKRNYQLGKFEEMNCEICLK